jgi:hypothetical protein
MTRLQQILTPKRMVLTLVLLAGLLGIITVVGWFTNPSTPASSGRVVPTVAEVQPRISITPPMPSASQESDCYPDAEGWDCHGRPQRRVIYDIDPARGAATCRIDLATPDLPRGSSCTPKPVNVDPHGGPGHYEVYDNNTERGRARCTEDLRHDMNLTAVCQVLPAARMPTAVG